MSEAQMKAAAKNSDVFYSRNFVLVASIASALAGAIAGSVATAVVVKNSQKVITAI